ncbi:unnamed protein product [Heligmosomoides polygyrus]|uniref:ZnF_CDGSH domain-containing protein n=1 Tax=Heligmosomoides polygyrus TaxID=6339 RepID=A0A183FBE1_HELPZ|nr:unnamed protein product [Heligmosomoides polygyrus]
MCNCKQTTTRPICDGSHKEVSYVVLLICAVTDRGGISDKRLFFFAR